MKLNQFHGIVPRSRDGRIEGSPGRLVRIFYVFPFFHTSRRVGLIFSVVLLMKCDLLNFRQWHLSFSCIQNTSYEFSSQSELFVGHPVFALKLFEFTRQLLRKCEMSYPVELSWPRIKSRGPNRSNTEPLCVRVKNAVDRWLIYAPATRSLLIEQPLDSV